MKVIILHGENVGKSYERLTKFTDVAKNRDWEIIYDLNITPSLFGNERLIILRDPKLITPKNLKILDKVSGTLVIYSEGNLPATFLKLFDKTVKIERFDVPKIIWKFLDYISIKLLHEAVKTEVVEFIFAMLAKRIRDLYWIKIDSKSFPYQSWQLSKLKKQSEKYSEEKLKMAINELSKIDIDVKTGKSEVLPSLDLLMIKHLE